MPNERPNHRVANSPAGVTATVAPAPTPMPQEGALARWSRRKAEVTVPPAVAAVEAEAPPALTDEDMPPVESLDADSDYSGFLSPQVSEELRRVALRKLFRSAVFNVRDGLDDYDDDFRNFAALGDLVTCDMKHQQEVREAREAAAREADEAAVGDEDGADDEVAETEEEEVTSAAGVGTDEGVTAAAPAAEPDPAPEA